MYKHEVYSAYVTANLILNSDLHELLCNKAESVLHINIRQVYLKEKKTTTGQ